MITINSTVNVSLITYSEKLHQVHSRYSECVVISCENKKLKRQGRIIQIGTCLIFEIEFKDIC